MGAAPVERIGQALPVRIAFRRLLQFGQSFCLKAINTDRSNRHPEEYSGRTPRSHHGSARDRVRLSIRLTRK